MKIFVAYLKPGNWTQFALGVVCLLAGIWNLMLTDIWWFNQVAIVISLFMAGFSISGSILMPWIDRLNKELNAIDPAATGKAAAYSFRDEIMSMQARGELPSDLTIEFGHKPPPQNRLN